MDQSVATIGPVARDLGTRGTYRIMNSHPVPASDATGLSSTDPDSRSWTNRKASAQAFRAATARNASGRRRFVDPTTCDRDYSEAEREFMQAMHEYKIRSGRMFPTWSEVLEVLKELGYEKPVDDHATTALQQPLTG